MQSYRQALRHTDRQIGRLLADFRRAGYLDELLPALTADHGMAAVEKHFPLEEFLRRKLALAVGRQRLWERSPFDRRLRDWQEAGVWDKVHRLLLSKLPKADQIDWSRAIADSASVRAVGGAKTGPNPTDPRKLGSKHHLLTHAHGIPLSAVLTGANRHDVTQLPPLVDAIPPVAGKVGRPRRRPERVQEDRSVGVLSIMGFVRGT